MGVEVFNQDEFLSYTSHNEKGSLQTLEKEEGIFLGLKWV